MKIRIPSVLTSVGPEASNVTPDVPVPKRSRPYSGSLARFAQRYPRDSKTQSTPEFLPRGLEREFKERGEGSRRQPGPVPAARPLVSGLRCSWGPASPFPDLESPAQTLWDSPGRSGGREMGGPRMEPRGLAAKPLFSCDPPVPTPGLQCHLGSLAPCPLGVVSQWEIGV